MYNRLYRGRGVADSRPPHLGGTVPLGERSDIIYNLAGAPYGGQYLEGLFDDIAKVADKVGVVSGELAKVASGQATVATIPTGQATLTLPIPGSPVSQAIPLWVIGLGAAGLLFLAFRRR